MADLTIIFITANNKIKGETQSLSKNREERC
jgi:hypothetical protein